MFKHLIFFGILITTLLNQKLNSESYSEHRLDDSLYWNGGARWETSESRFQSLPNLNMSGDESFLYGLDFYLPMSYRTQKGGLDEDLESAYLAMLHLSPEMYLGFIGKEFKSYLIIAPLVSYREEKILDRDIDRILDSEVILGNSIFSGQNIPSRWEGISEVGSLWILDEFIYEFCGIGIEI
jgi:hypothetical protein